VFIAGRIATAISVCAGAVIAVAVVGRLVYGVALQTVTLPAALLSLLVGAAAFWSATPLA